MANIKHVNSVVDRDFRNRINQLIDYVNAQGKSMQDLVAEGQLTPEQYAELITVINGLIKSGNIDKSDLTPEFKDEIEGFSSQLAQTEQELENKKADKTEVEAKINNINVSQINKNLGKFDQTYMSDEFLQQMTGSAPINAVPADGSLVTKKFADKAITTFKTDFAFESSNLFNKNDLDIKNGVRLSTADGTDTSPFSDSSVSGFIPITNGETYSYSHDYGVYGGLSTYALYDENKTLLEMKSATLSADKKFLTFTVSNANAMYIRTNVSTKTIVSHVFCKGAQIKPYEEYGKKWFDNAFSLTQKQIEEILKLKFPINQFDFIKASSNLFNKNDLEIKHDKRVTSSEGGDTATFTGSSVTGFMPVENGKSYIYPTNYGFFGALSGIAFYDENKNLIQIINGTIKNNSAITFTVTNPLVKYAKTNVKTTDIDSFMFCEGTELKPYEKYGEIVFDNTFALNETQKKQVQEIIDNPIEIKTNINLLLPPKVYVTCNDLTSDYDTARQYSASLYLDHTLENAIDENLVINGDNSEEKDKVMFYSQASFSGDVLTINNGKNIDETTKSIDVSSDKYRGKGIVKQISTKASVSKTTFPKVLFIGDSITYGVGSSAYQSGNGEYAYWGYVAKLFEFDRIDAGNNPAEYNFLSLGTRGAGGNVKVNYKGVDKTVRAACEGYSGWLLADILHHSNTLSFNQATWDSLGLGNGTGTDYTNSLVQRNQICLANQNDPTAVPVNAFFDNSKTGETKFSISKWIERYRTLDDNGNRLTVGSGTGTEITEANINSFNVCTPTHIVITIGRNDLAYCDEDTFIQNMNMFINQVKVELPNAVIGIVITPDNVGTMFPKRYKNIIDSLTVSSRPFYSLASRLMTEYGNREDENLYLIPFYFVQPTAWGQPLYRVDMPESIFGLDGFQKDSFLKYRPLGVGASIHPGSHCHAAWGYQLYSWLKYVMSK